MNSITDLLDLEDANISISSIDIEGQTKTIYLETTPEAHFCPCCGFRMHSRGTKNRKINHPILQDNYKLVLILKQRRWRCTNPDCLYDISDSFKFVSKNRRTTRGRKKHFIMQGFEYLPNNSAIVLYFFVSFPNVSREINLLNFSRKFWGLLSLTSCRKYVSKSLSIIIYFYPIKKFN